ncbi:MAG: S8 family serine peptidase, partial [Planctomycetaceae bacterium]|nr:S8 family serine peptidase [Planctomycetaceae bacterium]
MRKPCKVRNRTRRKSSDFLVAAELLERRYAFTATPFSDEFVSAAMEAVARGEITSDRWIVHERNTFRSSNNQTYQNLNRFGGNTGWRADPIGNSFFRLHTPGIRTSDVVSWARNNQDNFLFEPDLPVQVETSTNDPSLWRLYGLNNYGQAGGTSDADIDATEAWEITTGSHDVVIGVIDSGVDITHPDLAANIWVNPGETPNNGIDDDGNGFIDDVNGWDFYDDDNSPNDGNGHGTHVAGTIGAVGNNNLGITGVNWQVSLLPLRFLGNDGSGWTSDAVAAVNYATMLKRDFGINVAGTNNSWGGGGYSRTLDRAIQVANDEGIMFIAAAGNQGTNNDANPSYPTNYTSPNVISVAALNRNDSLASFSNYGATTVDVGAPGVSIYSTLPGNSYGSLSGTSMAAPHVAGVVGLLNAAKPGISVTEVTNAIFDSVDPLQSLNGKTLTGGRVNAASALTSLLGQPPSIDPIDNLVISSDKILNISVTASDIDGDVTLSLVVSESTTEEPAATVTLDGSALTITPIKGRYGAITVSLIATDEQSNTATTSFTVDTLQAVESEGAVTLNKDSFGKFYADDMPIYNSAGSHIGEDTSSLQAGWNIGGVETVNGTNRMLVYRDGDAHYWELNSTWQYQSHSNFYVDGTAQYFDVETQFQVDINNDETIGAPALILEAVESEGAVTLNKDSFGKFYADDMPIYNSAGSHIG